MIESIVNESGRTAIESIWQTGRCYRRDADEIVPLSNKELCLVNLELPGETKSFDVRKPLPAAVARAMDAVNRQKDHGSGEQG